jgi:hypothetical protein
MSDNCGVQMKCPSCNELVGIHNQALCYPDEWGVDGVIEAKPE